MSDSRFSRRDAFGLAAGVALAGAGATALAACGEGDSETGTTRVAATSRAPQGAADCMLAPELTEGPFYVPGEPERRDITEGRPGMPLRLELTTLDGASCEPLKGATIELWHADAAGEYSGVNGASGSFMRGSQPTDAKGLATFETIYPGWYMGRAVHIHVKAHVGGAVVHTGQLFFDDAVSSRVFASGAYAGRGEPDVTNAEDPIYLQGGDASTLGLHRAGDGYVGSISMGLQA